MEYEWSMELRQLRYFVAVAEELHFGRAAARLHMSQPPLSAQISQLEHEIGVKLLERSTRRVGLTQAGEQFRQRVVEILGSVEAAVEEAREADAGRRGRLRIGFVSSANFTVLPPAIRQFRELRPRVQLELLPLPSSDQIEAVHGGTLDVGLVRLPASATGLHVEVVMTEEMVAAIPDNHRLATHQEVGAEDLVNESMVLFPYQLMPGFVGQVLEMFASTCGKAPRVVQQAIHHETALGLVAAGVGLSILPASASLITAGGVRFLPIRSSPKTDLAIVRRLEEPSPASAAFIACLHDSSADRRAEQLGEEAQPERQT